MTSNECSFPNETDTRLSTNGKPRSTLAQTEALCTFFEENPEVIRGYKKTPECIDSVQAKWKKITHTLNALGPPRDCKAWAKYLCNMKAKLKRKRVKWRQNNDGTGLIICNSEDFNEINLRMLQVLRKDISSEPVTKLLAVDTESCIKKNREENNDRDVPDNQEPQKTANCFTEVCINVSDDDDSSAENIPQAYGHNGDEFDTFGKNVAQQLRFLPLEMALETQEMLLAVLRKQRLKAMNLNENKNQNVSDPLFT